MHIYLFSLRSVITQRDEMNLIFICSFFLREIQMAQGKRKSDVLESDISSEKYPKNASNILHLTDDHCLEKDYQNLFRTMADQLINHHELVVMEEHCFRLCEIEFYFYHSTRHSDTFAHRHPEQEHHSHWYFHRQGTSTTANYKAGTYK